MAGPRWPTIGTVAAAVAQDGLSISADGRRVAIARFMPERAARQLWVIDLETGVERQLLTSPLGHEDSFPIWSPDGNRIAFRSNRGTIGYPNLYVVNADGPPTVSLLMGGPMSMYAVGWAQHGPFVWASDSSVSNDADLGIWISSPGSQGLGNHYLPGARVNNARLCPTGSRIAYTSAVSGQQEVYLDSFPVPRPAPTACVTRRWRPSPLAERRP